MRKSFRLEDLLGHLPPHIDGSLVNLMRLSPPGRGELPNDERAALEWSRLQILQSVDHYFSTDLHRQAETVVASGRRFCLYLRNFSLGGTASEKFYDPDVDDVPMRATTIRVEDSRFQSLLREHVSPEIPVVCISNPVFDSSGKDALPRLYFTDESWAEGLNAMLRAAAVVVFYVKDPSSAGVKQELSAIAEARRNGSLILVLHPRAPSANVQAYAKFRWSEDQSFFSILEVIRAVLSEQQEMRTAAVILPNKKRCPDDVRDWFGRFLSHNWQDEVMSLTTSGEYSAAVDALYRGLSISFFVENVPARAAHITELARAYRHSFGNVAWSTTCYSIALRLWERLARDQPEEQSFREASSHLAKEYSEYAADSSASAET